MDLTWIATPYGLGAVGAVCVLAGFAVNKGIYWDKDDKVLKIGSKKHPKTLDRFNELFEAVKEIKTELEGVKMDVGLLKGSLEDANIRLFKLEVTNPQLPPAQRAEAYDECVRRGVNGWLKVYFERYVKPLIEKTLEDRLGGEV
jgi:hypothetical protein